MKNLLNHSLIAVPDTKFTQAQEILSVYNIPVEEHTDAVSAPFQYLAQALLTPWLEDTSLSREEQDDLAVTIAQKVVDIVQSESDTPFSLGDIVALEYEKYIQEHSAPKNRHEETTLVVIDSQYLSMLEKCGIPYEVKPSFQAFCEEEVRYVLDNGLLYGEAKEFYDNATPEKKERIFEAMVEELFECSEKWVGEDRLEICNDLITYTYLEEE
ncbi:MAG: hypothetical protein ACRCZZ_06880 [Phocaeicola sp.]